MDNTMQALRHVLDEKYQKADADLSIIEDFTSGTDSLEQAVRDLMLQAGEPVVRQNYMIVLDPGHQGSWLELPEGEEWESICHPQNMGWYSGVPEYQINLQLAEYCKEELESRGYSVSLTREDNNTAISNRQRMKFAEEKQADIMIQFHMSCSENTEKSGIEITIPEINENSRTGLLSDAEKLAGKQESCLEEDTGLSCTVMHDGREVDGIKWLNVPLVVVRPGYLTNRMDDLYWNEKENGRNAAKAIADAIDLWLFTE